LLALLSNCALPAPLVNEPIVVDGRVYVPDLRWGRLIIEVDSKLHHLLTPGAWAATLRRRARLEQAGYHVIPVTPEMIRDDPSGVLAMIMVAHQTYAA
jgi:very-short-patch-repair endonuclease